MSSKPFIGAKEYFPGIGAIPYEGPKSDNPLAFKVYDADRKIGGKTMREHLRFAVCYWHTFCNAGADPFGPGTRRFPWERDTAMATAEAKVDAAFEFFTKLGVPYYCFHDVDLAPDAEDVGTYEKNLKHLVAMAKERQQGGWYDTFRNRLMFPIVDVTGRIIGFGGRTMGEDPAKYLNTPATVLFDKGSQLFGLDRARQAISETGRVIIVEGYTDCIMCHQHGFREAVATLGTAMTDAHAALLRRYTDRVILLFDSDEAGKRAAGEVLALQGKLLAALSDEPRTAEALAAAAGAPEEAETAWLVLEHLCANGRARVARAGTPATTAFVRG